MCSPLYLLFKVKYSFPEANHQRHLVSGIRMNNLTQTVIYRQSVFLLVFIVEENKIYLYSVDSLRYKDLAHHSINIKKHNTNMA